MKKNIRMAKKYKAKVILFKNLPIQHQYAIIYYMAINGEAWGVSNEIGRAIVRGWDIRDKFTHLAEEKILKAALRTKKSMAFYIEKYGNWKFGVADIPTQEIIKSIMQERDLKKNFTSFPEYQNWFNESLCKSSTNPKHPKKNRWPCILSSYDDEVFEDGWHRFHCYSKRGDSTIPCVYYPNNCEPKSVK